MKPRKLIIGCGYLGRRVAAKWIEQGASVSALTRSSDNAALLREIGVEPVIGDVMDPASLTALPAADTVLYAVGLDRKSGYSQREVYVNGLVNVLARLAVQMCDLHPSVFSHSVNRDAREADHSAPEIENAPRFVPKFVYVSSTSVYGQNGGEWVDESSECRPDGPNGQVCLEAERLLRSIIPDSLILRLAGIYGPGRLVARIEQLRSGVPLAGNPEAWLNLIHVDDAATAILACECSGEPGSTTLVCDDRPNRRREYYTLLASLIGAPTPRFEDQRLDEIEHVRLNKRCCNRQLREALRAELKYPTIDDGLPEAAIVDQETSSTPTQA